MIVREQDGVKVILVDRLPPEVSAKVQALYARSPKSMEEHLKGIYDEQREAFNRVLMKYKLGSELDWAGSDEELDALMAVADADGSSAAKFMDTYYVGYGHASIGDCAVGGVLGVEGISELACKALQHWPLFSGQQTSTRAVDVSKARIIDPLNTPASRAVLERWMNFYTSSQAAVAAEVRRRYPRREGEAEKTYDKAVEYRVFDILRGFLPAGLTTQTSLAMNLRQLSDHLTWLLHHPLEEVHKVAGLVQAVLRERYPSSGSFGGSATLSGVGTKGESAERAAARDAWTARVAKGWAYRPHSLGAGGDSDTEEQQRATSANGCDFTRAGLWPEGLDHYADIFLDRPRGCVLPRFLDDLGTCTASFLLDWGAWRDIERQRSLTIRVPMLTMEHGFEPWYLDQFPGVEEGLTMFRDKGRSQRVLPSSYSGLALEALQLIEEQKRAIEALTDDPLLRQYYIPFGFRVPTTITGPLPAFVYVLELRTGTTVHPALRGKMLEVAKQFRDVFGDRVPLHVDESLDSWDVRRGTHTIEKRSDDEKR